MGHETHHPLPDAPEGRAFTACWICNMTILDHERWIRWRPWARVWPGLGAYCAHTACVRMIGYGGRGRRGQCAAR